MMLRSYGTAEVSWRHKEIRRLLTKICVTTRMIQPGQWEATNSEGHVCARYSLSMRSGSAHRWGICSKQRRKARGARMRHDNVLQYSNPGARLHSNAGHSQLRP